MNNSNIGPTIIHIGTNVVRVGQSVFKVKSLVGSLLDTGKTRTSSQAPYPPTTEEPRDDPDYLHDTPGFKTTVPPLGTPSIKNFDLFCVMASTQTGMTRRHSRCRRHHPVLLHPTQLP
ncbi:hypothetical protein VZT92_005013 [Zoarces viviparus]|uniref:Uncharacterized protein n=1 Tax=Zoarces viviparus TaxID=48416 RepID=A0AAW1FT87_ZOAVI